MMMPRQKRPVIDLAAAIGGELGGDRHKAPETALPGPAASIAPRASSIPDPHSPTGHGQLSTSEETDLTTCEAALDNLRMAFWAAGKALQVIRDARLYRGTHDTFEEYLAQRWDMSRAQAYRLIDAWPLAERLSPIGDTITESQVRELLPLAGQHGQDAAAIVYQTVAETDGVRVTAAVLRDVVDILPADYFDPAETVSQIHAYLVDGVAVRPLPTADPVQAFTSETARFLKGLQRVANGDVIKAARSADPELVRRTVAGIRAVLDEIEQQGT